MTDLREDWLAERRHYITGSWLAPILGIPSPAGTELDAWAWFVHGYRTGETEPMIRGRQLESAILDMFAEAHGGAHVGRWPEYRLAGAEPGRIWASTLDGLTCVGLPEGIADAPELASWRRGWAKTSEHLASAGLPWGIPVEAKNVGWAWRDWADGPPPHVVAQVQVQIDSVGAPFAYVAALLQGCEFRWWRIPRREAFIRDAKLYCRRWWDRHVERGEMPAVDGRVSTSRILAYLSEPKHELQAIALPPEATDLRADVEAWRIAKRDADAEANLAANKLRAMMGKYPYAVCGDGGVVSHKKGRLTLVKALPRDVEEPTPWSDQNG
ncbi:MAG: YqaJ viral recombinase family protein [Kiloniellales bacterium]